MDLFHDREVNPRALQGMPGAPLAERARPATIEQFAGQRHLLSAGKALRVFLDRGSIPSLILWGPPGCGKTTLARIISSHLKADYYQLNAVSSGVGDLRKVIERAALAGKKMGRRSLLFIDEIHRFNKAQQDALLHSVEDGTIILVGATTENPSFEVISPLLSRCRVFTLEPLNGEDLAAIVDMVLADPNLLGGKGITLGDEALKLLIMLAGGDARQMLNGLEAAVTLIPPAEGEGRVISENILRDAFQSTFRRYDKAGEEHYNIISAFIKSVRGSDPDAALYWLARMIDAGEDPKFMARRLIVLASEDIGNADPAALPLAVACFTAVQSIGMPEARIALSQTTAYLSVCPKSNAAIRAIDAALADVRNLPAEAVPLHLRNAPTGLMKEIGYGSGYLYPHDSPGNYIPQQYLPAGLKGKRYYEPSQNGREADIGDRLNSLREKP